MLTSDGFQEGVAAWAPSECCSFPCDYDPCTSACSFIDLLPSGPMWDQQKMEALARFQFNGQNPCLPSCQPESPCASMVDYAVFQSIQLGNVINGALWPALREANPYTAVTTLDDWLQRLGWENCFQTTCRSVLLGDLTALEILGECGPIFCPTEFGEELGCAVKKAIVAALSRLQRGIVKNLAGINWVLEPLGVEVTPWYPETNEFGDPCVPEDCCDVQFEICTFKDTLPACGPLNCWEPTPDEVPAYSSLGCDRPAGQPAVVWPGVLAAECILRSLLHRSCPNIIHRCCLEVPGGE